MKPEIWIAVGGAAPQDPAANTDFHETLLAQLKDDAITMGWPGMALCHYHREAGVVGVGAGEGDSWPDLDDLRAFREAEHARMEQMEKQDHQHQTQGVLL